MPILFAVAVAGCQPDARADVETLHAFVRRSGPTVDTLRIERGAERVALTVDLAVVRGRAAWALYDPSGLSVWSGAIAEADTLATWAADAPAAGDWRLEVRPDSAIGTLQVTGRVR